MGLESGSDKKLFVERSVMVRNWSSSGGISIGFGREKQLRNVWRREREKIGRKKEHVGPVTVINWGPHEFSPNSVRIQD
jgi:hypothetical protein